MSGEKDEKRTEHAGKPTQLTVILRLGVGGYLVYLAFGLLQEYLKPVGGDSAIQLGCAILFGVVGAAIGGWAFKKLIKGEYIKYGALEDEEEDADQSKES